MIHVIRRMFEWGRFGVYKPLHRQSRAIIEMIHLILHQECYMIFMTSFGPMEELLIGLESQRVGVVH